MRTASWDELDADATYYGWHNPRTGHVHAGGYRLTESRHKARSNGALLVAVLDNIVVRVPDGDPPVPAPWYTVVPTIEKDGGTFVDLDAWLAAQERRDSAKPSLAELQRASDEAELAWLDVVLGETAFTSYTRQMRLARAALLRARLAEGEKS